jgi:hypothetical protein
MLHLAAHAQQRPRRTEQLAARREAGLAPAAHRSRAAAAAAAAASAAAAVQRARSVAKVRVYEEGAAPAHARHPFYPLANPEPRLPVENGDVVAGTQLGNDLIVVPLSSALGRLQHLACRAQLGLHDSQLLLQAKRRRVLLPAEERLRVSYGDADSVVQGIGRVQAATRRARGAHATLKRDEKRSSGEPDKVKMRVTWSIG